MGIHIELKPDGIELTSTGTQHPDEFANVVSWQHNNEKNIRIIVEGASIETLEYGFGAAGLTINGVPQ